MLFSGSVMTGEDGASREVVGIARDITEHRRAEEMAKNMLLVKEIHHRIKNNLQVISSLLYLQSSYVEDGKTRDMFTESQNRVRSMALLHEKLYQSASPAGVAFAEYVRDLTRNLFVSYGVQTSLVELSIEMAGITLGMDTAVPCGLIINELVSNSLKHAFPEGRLGKIAIEMHPCEECGAERWYLLTVSDDGTGFPEGLDFRTTESLGLKLVCTLTEQLSGTVDLDRGRGTRFHIRFREL
jgi:two-component sensor histidine kinase